MTSPRSTAEPSPPLLQSHEPVPLPPSGHGRRQRFVAARRADGSYPRWVLCAALSGMAANGFSFTILAVSLGAVAEELHTTETTIAWVITAPLLFSAVSLPVLGKLGDLNGHRRVYLLGSTLAMVTAFTTVFAWNAASLIALRTVSAMVGGATQPSSMALIFTVFKAEQRPRAMGWWSMVGAGSPALGLIAGGPLVDLFGWRLVFVLQGSFALVALALAWLVLSETQPQRVRFDLAGAFFLAVGVGSLMYALSQLRGPGLLAPGTLAVVAVAAPALLLFVYVEGRTAAPLLPLEFFRRRNFTAPIISAAFMGSAYMGAFVLAPLLLRGIFAFSISAAALMMVLRTLTLSLSSPFGGRLGERLGVRTASMLGTSLIALSMLMLASGAWLRFLPAVAVGLVLQGLGQGLCLPSLNTAVADSVPATHLGIATAANRLTNQVGTAFGITLLTVVAGGSERGFGPAFLVGFTLSALSVLAASFIKRRLGGELEALGS